MNKSKAGKETLLEIARRESRNVRNLRPVSSEDIDLAVALMEGKVSHVGAAKAWGIKSVHNARPKAAAIIVAAMKNGLISIVRTNQEKP